eukprot:6178043-Pleurochrysis_carterae.AAC.1
MDDHANRGLAYKAQHVDKGRVQDAGGITTDRLLGQRLGCGAFNHGLLNSVRRGGGGLRLQTPTLHLPLVDRS